MTRQSEVIDGGEVTAEMKGKLGQSVEYKQEVLPQFELIATIYIRTMI